MTLYGPASGAGAVRLEPPMLGEGDWPQPISRRRIGFVQGAVLVVSEVVTFVVRNQVDDR